MVCCPPSYNICTSCTPSGPQVTWSMTHNISSPSLSGNATLMDIGGETDYSDVLWNNHLIGDFSSQGMPDTNHTIVPALHNFTYDVYFYVKDLGVSQALEFDINQFVGGYSYIWGHECRVAGGNEWDIWDNPGQKWHPTGVACNPVANAWNHLVLQVQRTSDNQTPVRIDHAQWQHRHSQLLRKPHDNHLVWRDHQLPAGWGLPADGLLGLARQTELQLLVTA